MAPMSDLEFRPATVEDVPTIVAMLADDPLGASRESPEDLRPYLAAFERLATDPNQRLIVAVLDGEVVGTLQLTFVPGLSRRASTRAIIEAVRVNTAERGHGVGGRMLTWAIEEARRESCALVQLTSDLSRTDAHRFYEQLGFTGSHLGFKREL